MSDIVYNFNYPLVNECVSFELKIGDNCGSSIAVLLNSVYSSPIEYQDYFQVFQRTLNQLSIL